MAVTLVTVFCLRNLHGDSETYTEKNPTMQRKPLHFLRKLAAISIVVCMAPAAVLAYQTEEPKVGDPARSEATAVDQAKPAKPKREPIYDEQADAIKDIEQALAKAKKENRRVLIQWGANWCGWCYRLHDVMKDNAEIRRKLMYEYDVVLVDIGKLDKNEQLIEKYQAELKTQGVPYLTVLDGDGNVVTNQETASLESKEEGKAEHVPEAVLEFLTKHQSSPLDAAAVVEAGVAQAGTDSKLVFLHFGAPWCGWCHYLENWMAEPANHDLLSRVFVDVKVDTDRMQGGEEILKKYCKQPGGIPWFVFLDGKGEAIVDSHGSDGNIGFPSAEHEIAHFVSMLEKTQKFTAEEIEQLNASLVENRERREAARAARTSPMP